MNLRDVYWRFFPFALVAMWLSLSGCSAALGAHGENDPAVGEEHEVNFPAEQTFVMTQDVLRGQGVLFDVKPGSKIVTQWRPSGTPVNVLAAIAGTPAQYRYEIEVAPEGSHRSKIIANVRGENIANDQLDNFKASKRINLFVDFDQLANMLPPPPSTPGSGGVNFALLPGEDLAALSKRVTGNPDNWPQIAKDNGLKSVNDTAGVQSVWVENQLLPAGKQPPPPESP